jgi:O-antigen/teichoic acid export membrane protein
MSDSLGIYLPTAVIYRLIGLARGVILAWLLAATEFGLFQIALVGVNVLVPLAGVNLNEAMMRYVPQFEARHGLRAFLRRAWPMMLLVSAGLCGAALLAARPLTGLMFGTTEAAGEVAARVGLTRWTVGASLAVIVYLLLLAVLRGLRMFLAVSVMELAGGVSFTIATVVVALCGRRSADAMMAVHVATYGTVAVLMGLLLAGHLRRTEGWREPPEAVAEAELRNARMQMLGFGVWTALAAVLWQIMHCYPMWYLQRTQGPEATAVFGSVRLISQAVLIGATSVVMVVQAAVTRTWETQGRESADRQLCLAFKATGLVMLAGCAVLVLAAPLVMRMFPAAYGAGVRIMPVMLAFFMICGYLSFVVVHFVLIEKTRYVFGLWLAGAVSNAALACVLVRPGMAMDAAMEAAAWAGLLGAVIALMVSLVWMRIERRPLDLGSAVLMVSVLLLVTPVAVMAVCVVILIGVGLLTDVILSRPEKTRLADSVRGWAGRIRKSAI